MRPQIAPTTQPWGADERQGNATADLRTQAKLLKQSIGEIFGRTSRVLVIAALLVRPALWAFTTTNRITG